MSVAPLAKLLPGIPGMPSPEQLLAAGANIGHKVLYGGLADLRPMPRTLIDDGTLREVYHYRPGAGSHPTGLPVLLVTPLAAPALCFDLRRGCSLVEHLVKLQRPTYLVEYGEVSFADRRLGVEHWIDEVLPAAVRAVSEHAGGQPVHLVGWSLGGIFATLAAADHGDLPIASVTALGSPFDVSRVPLIAPFRPLVNLADGALLGGIYRVLGGAPKPLVRRAFQLSSIDKLVTKPLAVVRNLDDAEFLAQIEAVDRFTANMIAYPGRSFGQLYHRFLRANALASGGYDLDDRRIELSTLDKPLLVLAGSGDSIAPIASVQPLVEMVPQASPRFEVVPGGHLGMLTGRAARGTTWKILDGFMTGIDADHLPAADAPPTEADPATTDSAPATAPIGMNRKRQHSSAATRSALKR
ncbi:MAG: alpha/beta fold hydrolase [Nocardioidaceae bacterium]